MSQYEVEQNGIIYIIPDDELYQKYMNNEAFIDEYGRLIDRKPHRVLKELRHFASNVQADDSDENYSYELSSPPWWIELLRDVARELWNDEEFRANVKELYHLKIKPACKKNVENYFRTVENKSKPNCCKIKAC